MSEYWIVDFQGEGALLESCLHLRKAVFCDEQNVPIDEEVDGLDDTSHHYAIFRCELPPQQSRGSASTPKKLQLREVSRVMTAPELCAQYSAAQRNASIVATCRTRVAKEEDPRVADAVKKGKAKIQRVAVRMDHRNRGIGKCLMDYVLEQLRAIGQPDGPIAVVVLGAQAHAIPFYEHLGFTVYSDLYLDAGIEHKDMKMYLHSTSDSNHQPHDHSS
eukprot:ANDGO_03143.mRNA.1 Putative acetyltransferase SAR1027